MKYLFLIGVILLIGLSACKKERPSNPVDVETLDEAWMKLSLTGQQRGVSAIYGSIDDTLVVATMYRIYITTDRGASWQLVSEANVGISGFYMVDGELCAFSTFRFEGEDEFATTPFLYSVDHGRTWSSNRKFGYQVYDTIRRIRDRVSVEGEGYYRIDNNLQLTDNSGMSFVHGPNSIIKGREGFEESVYFPFKRYLNYLHLDGSGRLYAGAESTRFEAVVEGNVRIFPAHSDSAILYVSRKPIGEW
ncbi:MAG: hypothetical protein EAS52_19215 [Parapedobacter sp.]|nr:MAG: hypothetical protein EAS52_19215 [Parapedobacter sp.]